MAPTIVLLACKNGLLIRGNTFVCLIERVQRRATTLVPQLNKLNYDEKLKILDITSLVDRRIRGDMIETYNIITGKE